MSTPIQRSIPTALAIPALNLDISPELARRLFWTPDSAYKQGVHLMGGPGSGKSRFLGRVFAWLALVRGFPSVIFDPTGTVTDNLFDKLYRLPAAIGQPLAERLTYIDAGAKDFVVPTPFYTRHSATESYEDIANRLIEVLVQEDPQLESAPILGKNALVECASYAGQIAAQLGLQIEFAYDLVRHPNKYADLLTYAEKQDPELKKAANFFREFMGEKSKTLHERKTLSFLNKLHPFLSDKAVRASFNAVTPGIDWPAVVRNRQTVLIDFRHEWDTERRQFKLLWWLKDFTTFAKHRGTAGRGEEVMLVIDELTALLGYKKVSGESVLAQEIEELTTVLGRNFGVNVVIAHQNLRQLDERIQTALMQMGNQCLFRLAHPDDTLLLARYFLTYDPHRVRKWETHWSITEEGTAFSLDPTGLTNGGKPYRPLSKRKLMFPIGTTTTEFDEQQQYIMLADKVRNVEQFHFYLRPALAEGRMDNHLYLISLKNLDRGEYPDATALSRVRTVLRQQSGRPVDAVLAEMAAHTGKILKAAKQARITTTKEKETLPKDDTIGEPAHDTRRHAVSRPATPTKASATAQPPQADVEEDPFR